MTTHAVDFDRIDFDDDAPNTNGTAHDGNAEPVRSSRTKADRALAVLRGLPVYRGPSGLVLIDGDRVTPVPSREFIDIVHAAWCLSYPDETLAPSTIASALRTLGADTTLPRTDRGAEPASHETAPPAEAHERIDDDDDRPVIRAGVDVHRVVDDAVRALVLDGTTYSRGGALARVVHSAPNTEGRVRRSEAATLIRPHSAASMFETLTRVARWERYDGRVEEWKPGTPSKQVVAALIDRAAWHGIPDLVGLAATPILRADGSIAQEPGFDADSGYLLTFASADFATVAEAPTRVDALAARDAVLEIVCDFPFATDADRSAWLALLFTVFARAAILGPVPLFLLLSNVRGAGKSRLVDAVAILKTGRVAARATQPADEAEAGKVFTSVLLEGDEIVLIDNIAHAIGGAKLDALLTGEVWKDRLLGGNVTANLPIRTTFCAGGNNLEIIGDTQRRTLPSTLESPLEKPEDREDFRHADLLAWLRGERARLVVAVLTILRAWFVAGRPKQDGVRQWGSYESFASLVPHVIRWIDLADPQATRLEIEARDPMKQALGTILRQWSDLERACGRVDGLTVREAIDKLYPTPPMKSDETFNDLRDALEILAPGTGATRVSGRALGKAFQKACKRTVNGRRLQRAEPDAHTQSNRWVVR